MFASVPSACCMCAGQQQYFNGDNGGSAAMGASETEMYPYVSFTISIES